MIFRLIFDFFQAKVRHKWPGDQTGWKRTKKKNSKIFAQNLSFLDFRLFGLFWPFCPMSMVPWARSHEHGAQWKSFNANFWTRHRILKVKKRKMIRISRGIHFWGLNLTHIDWEWLRFKIKSAFIFYERRNLLCHFQNMKTAIKTPFMRQNLSQPIESCIT